MVEFEPHAAGVEASTLRRGAEWGGPAWPAAFSAAVEDGLQGGCIEDAVGPDVELVQRGGLEARGGLLVERAEAFG